MSNKSFFNTRVALGAMALGLATTASLMAQNPAEAANLKFVVDGTFFGGGDLTGSFLYDTTANTYSSWNLRSTADTITQALGDLANPFTYTETSAPILGGLNSATQFSVRTGNSPTPRRILNLFFADSLASLSVGDTTTLVPYALDDDTNLPSGSRDAYFAQGVNQTAGVFGGTLTATAIPEPLTILGTFLAGGIGVGMKRKKQQLEKETC